VDGQIRNFKRCLAIGASHLRIKFSEFLEARGVNDFLVDEDGNGSSPKDLASRALDELTVGDRQSMDVAVCIAVVEFLESTLDRIPEDPDGVRRVRDLMSLASSRPSRSQYSRMFDGWWP